MISPTESLSQARLNPMTVFHEFQLEYKAFGSCVIGFVEGELDVPFYKSAIESKMTGKHDRVEVKSVTGRENVITLLNICDWSNRFRSCVTLFFIDRDFTDYLGDSILPNDRLYVTDGYSIENNIVTKESCGRVLIEMYNLSSMTGSEKNRILEMFENGLDKIQLCLAPLMVWIIDKKKTGVKFDLNSIIMKDLFKIDFGRVVMKNKTKGNKTFKQYIEHKTKEKYILNSYLKSELSKFILRKEHVKFTRGKYLSWYLFSFCNYISSNISKFTKLKLKKHEFSERNLMFYAAVSCRCPKSLSLFLENNLK